MKKCLKWIFPMLLAACAAPSVEVNETSPKGEACASECHSGGGGGGCCSMKPEAVKADGAAAASAGCCAEGAKAAPKTDN